MPKRPPKPQLPPKLPPPPPAGALFRARFLGYLVGLLPIVGMMLLLLRPAVPQWVGLLLTTAGLYFSIQLQQAAVRRFAYNFSNREEWLALGLYAAVVAALVLSIPYWR
ncbi:hypothetical protein E5K00_07700 [Hymenobacter aquaticus]|uniref:Uncharacterized protein n=1 Tax=Hymenobacter aquaticus TaxID=1867101 RepID=A0A4Z0Q8N7_9BACT|nr:hypothetical protein [Hymenobacter aquaticus]TGE25072.1 hypothetical protein E5K00_07700 [Hymenobacter aquaticus]